MYPQKQTFLILGLSRSGRAVTEFLLARGATCYVYDDIAGERIESTAQALAEKGAKRAEKEELGSMADKCDILVLSPGIPIDHPLAVAFKRKGKSVVGETEIAARYMRCLVVAITGTNGKTTTVSMLTDVLNKSGLTAKACGNVGTPMVEFCSLSEEDCACLDALLQPYINGSKKFSPGEDEIEDIPLLIESEYPQAALAEQIKEGMTYSQVVEILGSEGVFVPRRSEKVVYKTEKFWMMTDNFHLNIIFKDTSPNYADPYDLSNMEDWVVIKITNKQYIWK